MKKRRWCFYYVKTFCSCMLPVAFIGIVILITGKDFEGGGVPLL